MEHDPSLIVDAPGVQRVVDAVRALRPGDAVALDTEATGLQVFTNRDRIRGLSIAWHGDDKIESFYLPISHPHTPNVDVSPLIEALNETEAVQSFHNATYDWKTLSQVGLKPRWGDGAYYDTETMAWLQNENYGSALKKQGALWFGEDEAAEQQAMKAVMKGTPAKEIMALIRPGIRKGKVRIAQQWAKEMAALSKKTWATLTGDDIAKYAAQDTSLTLRLKDFQRTYNFGDTDPWPDIERELRLREVVYRIIDEGVMIERGEVEQLHAKYLAEQRAIESEFDFNLNAPQQLAHFLYDDLLLPVTRYTKTGRSTDKESLEAIAELHPAVERILEWRQLQKMTGTYLGPMMEWADEDDRIHSSINVTGTVTGRFSSSGPNMQNIPREATNNDVKKLFRARPGFELVEVDLHSAELFVGASLANDEEMIAALSDATRDFHTETAIKVFGNAEGQNRTLAKNLNYGIPYGIGPTKFASYLVKGTGRQVTRQHVSMASSIINRHKIAWPVTHTAISRMTRFAELNHYIPLHVPGRYRHFRGPGIIVPAYTAFNAVVQGGVAEFVKDVMILVERPLAEIGVTIVLQVHDSLWLEVPKGNSAEALRVVQMVTDDINPFRIRMLWDAKTLGRNPS